MTTSEIAAERIPTYKTNRRRAIDPLPAGPDVGTPLSPPSTAPGVASSVVPRSTKAAKLPAPPLPLPGPGDEVSYRCAALGQFYPARIVHVRPDGTLDVDVLCSPPLSLTKRPWHAGKPRACPPRACTAPSLRGSI
ncbi:MAG: hypothetical protein KGL39_40470 [Patescibacteria group bacterium]|nr:hypothetical protein [Patescibacteria group bacterium]